MKRTPPSVLLSPMLWALALTASLASGLLAPDLRAQDQKRLQPTAPDFNQQVNTVFGDLIGAVSYYPFYNIAGWFGLDTGPQLRLEDGKPSAAHKKVLVGDRDATVVNAHFGPGDTIVAQLSDGSVMLTSPEGMEWLTIEHGSALVSAQLSPLSSLPDSGELMTAGADGRVRVWRIQRKIVPGEGGAPRTVTFNHTEVFSLGGHGGGITSATYSPDGLWIATGDADGTLRLWGESGDVKHSMQGHEGGVQSIAFASSAADEQTTWVVALDGRGFAQVWTQSGENLLTANPGAGKRLVAAHLAPDGKHLAGLRSDGKVVVFASTGAVLKVLAESAPSSAVWMAWSDAETLRVIRAEGKEAVYTAPGFDEDTAQAKDFGRQLDVSAGAVDGSYYAILGGDGSTTPTLTKLGAADGEATEWSLELGGAAASASFNGSADRALTVTDDGALAVWEWYQRGPDGGIVATSIPFVVLWLVVAAVLFTVFMGFVNIRMFKHAIAVVAGKFSDPNDHGEVSHFQALASALSATVGLGNIAGVAIAVSVGGPGATFWMVVAGLLGMTLKFTECTLGQKFRTTRADGRVSGGPMHYLKDGLAQKGLSVIGVPLALIFTLFCIGGSLAGGNAFQVNQSLGILQSKVEFFKENGWVYGVVMAFFVGIVIIGGIKRIAQTAEKIVPTMCSLYVLAALAVIIMNIDQVPGAFGAIFGSALSGDAVYGGALGALIMGFRRAAFSNEAGVGSASIAHSAARTPYAVREGIVALLEPFIDTVVVCTITALVIVITGVYQDPQHAELVAGNNGAALTLTAFESVGTIGVMFGWLLMIAVVLFAFSTMISWSYYGERCWTNLFGDKSSLLYKMLFLVFVVLGSIVTATNVLEFGDLMILLMAFPNIFGLYFLGGLVKRELKDYEKKMAAGEIRRFK